MSIGLAMPLGANISGGAQLSDSDEQLSKIILLALSDGENDNPFQDVGLSPTMIFSDAGPTAINDVKRKISALFRILKSEHKAELTNEGLRFDFNESRQELSLKFRYINLETDEEQEFGLSLNALGQVSQT